MDVPFSLIGLWWLPIKAEKRLPGILSFSQDEGIFLEVIGLLDSETKKPRDNKIIILGEVQQGKSITLYQCMVISVNAGSERYRVKFAFEGVHFEEEARIIFRELCGSYTDLDAWVNIYGFEIDVGFDDGEVVTKTSFTKPAVQYYSIDDVFDVGVGFSSGGPETTIVQTDVHISQRAYLIVRGKIEELPFLEIFERLNSFVTFVEIAA